MQIKPDKILKPMVLVYYKNSKNIRKYKEKQRNT